VAVTTVTTVRLQLESHNSYDTSLEIMLPNAGMIHGSLNPSICLCKIWYPSDDEKRLP